MTSKQEKRNCWQVLKPPTELFHIFHLSTMNNCIAFSKESSSTPPLAKTAPFFLHDKLVENRWKFSRNHPFFSFKALKISSPIILLWILLSPGWEKKRKVEERESIFERGKVRDKDCNLKWFSLPLLHFSLHQGHSWSKMIEVSMVGKKFSGVNTSGIYRGKYPRAGIIPNTRWSKVFISNKYHGKYQRLLLSPKIIPGIFPILGVSNFLSRALCANGFQGGGEVYHSLEVVSMVREWRRSQCREKRREKRGERREKKGKRKKKRMKVWWWQCVLHPRQGRNQKKGS